MLMRFGRTSGRSTGVWPCTTMCPKSASEEEEGLANPDQVFRILLLYRAARPDAGMNEQIWAELHPAPQSLEESAMIGGKMIGKGGANSRKFPLCRERADIQAVGSKRCVAAVMKPVREALRLGEGVEQHILVVSNQADTLVGNWRGADQALDELARLRTSVDVVAEEDFHRLFWARSREIGADERLHGPQKVKPPMQIADGIDGKAVRQGARRALTLRGNSAHGIGISPENFGT